MKTPEKVFCEKCSLVDIIIMGFIQTNLDALKLKSVLKIPTTIIHYFFNCLVGF